MENTWIADDETIREFLAECHENLERLDRDLIELEKHPSDSALLSSVFRTFHTIKGSCGFLAFSHLEQITHQAENLLSQLRDRKRVLNSELVSLILETVDATRLVLSSIEASGGEGETRFEELISRLQQTAQSPQQPNASQEIEKAVPPPAPELPPVEAVVTTASETPQVSCGSKQEPAPQEEKHDVHANSAAEEESARTATSSDPSIRVGVGVLDKLMDLVGELVLTRNQILQTNLDREDSTLNTSSQRLNLITTELQEQVMKTRMQPIRVVWGNFSRIVRDIAVSLNKQIRLTMDGAETELDRTIIEAIKDPLMHLVRNSCDHGIEMPDARIATGKAAAGTISLRAYHEGGQVTIEITDDGRGIDLAKVRQKAIKNGLIRPELAKALSERETVNLIFLPGLSTAETVTKISGRGVGMDVVKSQIEKIGGIIDIFTRVGEGTTVKIRIPLTLAIIPGLIVTCSGERFVIPQVSLLELIQLEHEADGKRIEYLHGAPVFRRRGSLLPVVYLSDVLGLPRVQDQTSSNMVVLQTEDRQFGLIVDSINDTQEIVVKPLGKQFKGLSLYAGATIMGDGDIALILDVLGIGQSSGVLKESRQQLTEAKAPQTTAEAERHRLLLVRAGSFTRIAIPLSLVGRLEEFSRESIESAGGGYVVQYRDRILPLVVLQTVLEPGKEPCIDSLNTVPVIVFNDGDQSIGVVVDQIVDVTEEQVTVRQQTRRKGLLGSAVVGKSVTDFLDLSAVISASKEVWLHSNGGSTQSRSLLLTGASAFSRGLLRGMLEMSGYSVQELKPEDSVVDRAVSGRASAVISLIGQPSEIEESISLSRRLRAADAEVPMLAVAAFLESDHIKRLREAGVTDCPPLPDRAGIVDAIEEAINSARNNSHEVELTAEVA